MAPPKQSPDLLFAGFNQDFSCISVGTKKGFSIINCDPYGSVHTNDENATGVVEMLFCTSLVALVGAADTPKESPRRLQIVNTKRKSTICELLFPTSILGVKLNRKRLVVILEEEIYMYDISTMNLLHTIDTSPNPNAVCTLSPSSENSYLAYPAPVSTPASPLSSLQPPPPNSAPAATGDVCLFDTLTLSATNVIQAHKTPIACLTLNSTGTMLATCSDKGTVIRVWSVPGADKIAQFRRGTYPARIYSINFNAMSTLLGVSSDSDTIHIFKLGGSATNGSSASSSSAGNSNALPPTSDGPGSPTSLSSSSPYETHLGVGSKPPSSLASSATSSLRRRSMHLTKSLAGSVGGYLPSGITELWEPQRDFAFIKLRSGGVRCVVGLAGSTPQVYVISSTGLFHAYNIDLQNGGECELMKEFSLLMNDGPSGSMPE